MPMFKKSLLILLVLALSAIGGTMYGYYTEQSTISLDAGTNDLAETKRVITVYVTGEVKKPGLVTLTEGQRVADAVNAVGGVIETADVDRINMAAFLEDGMQVRVPERVGGFSEGSKPAVSGKNAEGLINLNTASEKELQELPGIGPAMSARIIEYREANGDFQNIEDIKKVRGIGNAKFEKLKDKVTI
ncbi:MAG: helix-hairpin-helix domain-containing protein [Centipeda sp. (in: firmicutes)]